jgi:hypothetical protein
MSTIAGVASMANPYQSTDQSGFGQIVHDFNSICNALQSGNVSAAQSALSAFQQDLQGNSQTSASQPFGSNSQANTDFQSLVSSLQKGDLSSAQKAFASLQTDLQSAQTSPKKGHGGHHHHGGGGGSAAALINSLTSSSSTTSTASTTTNPLAALVNGTTANSNANSEGVNDGRTLNVTA